MVAVRDSDIRRAILTALSRQGDPATLNVNVSTALDTYMADPLLRTNCYSVAMGVAEEDSGKRAPIARLLCAFLVGFPPEESVMRRVDAMCSRFVTMCPEGEKVWLDLQRIARGFLDAPPLQLAVAKPPSSSDPHFTPGEQRTQAPSYVTHLPSFQPLSDENNNGKRSTTRVAYLRYTEADCAVIIEEKNRLVKPPRVLFQPAQCRDYTAQTRLAITRELLEQQVKALGTYADSYKTNPSVIRATNFIIKVICDAYVGKMPVGGAGHNYCLLREVSMAFVSIFLKLLESEYLCVRLHIFDLLLTLSVHLQLMDTSNTFTDLMPALQQEITWLYGRVLEKMARTETIEGVWMTALKSTLAAVPPSGLCTLDALVLRQWLFLPSVASCHPHIYAALSEALALKLLGISLPPEIIGSSSLPSSSKRHSSCTVVGAPEYNQGAVLDYLLQQCPVMLLDEGRVMAALGPHGVVEVIQFYSMARTVSARLYLFVVLFAMAAWRQHNGLSTVGHHAAGDGILGGSANSGNAFTAHQVARTLRVFVAKSLHWHMVAMVCYQSHALTKDLPASLLDDMAIGDLRDLKAPITTLLLSLLGLIASYRRLPDMLTTMLHHTADDFFALGQVARECCSVIPYMVREDVDYSLRRTAGQLVYHLLRIFRSPQHAQLCNQFQGMPEDDAATLIMTTVTTSTIAKVRELSPDIIAAFVVLCRTNPQHAKTLTDLLKLAIAKEKAPSQLLAITYALVEGLAVQHGGLTREGDLMSLAQQGELHILQRSAELIGSSIFWSLYWGLRHSQLCAAHRARLMLLSIIAALPSQGVSSATQIALWVRCMSDPHAPAAYVASRQVVRLAAVNHHEAYEKAVDMVQARNDAVVRVSNPYALATCIWEVMDAESRAVVE